MPFSELNHFQKSAPIPNKIDMHANPNQLWFFFITWVGSYEKSSIWLLIDETEANNILYLGLFWNSSKDGLHINSRHAVKRRIRLMK